jgi:hypothetical protein
MHQGSIELKLLIKRALSKSSIPSKTGDSYAPQNEPPNGPSGPGTGGAGAGAGAGAGYAPMQAVTQDGSKCSEASAVQMMENGSSTNHKYDLDHNHDNDQAL